MMQRMHTKKYGNPTFLKTIFLDRISFLRENKPDQETNPIQNI